MSAIGSASRATPTIGAGGIRSAHLKIGVVGGWVPPGPAQERRHTQRAAARGAEPADDPDAATGGAGVAPAARPPVGPLVAPSFVAAREEAQVFGPRLLAEAARRGALDVVDWAGGRVGPGVAQLRRVRVVADGALWIWGLADDHFAERVEILDFFHAAEQLTTVAHLAFGEGTAEAKAWAER